MSPPIATTFDCLSEETANRIACDYVSGPENMSAYSIEEYETQLRATVEAAERAQTSCEFGCPDGEGMCGQCESLLGGIKAARSVLAKEAT